MDLSALRRVDALTKNAEDEGEVGIPSDDVDLDELGILSGESSTSAPGDPCPGDVGEGPAILTKKRAKASCLFHLCGSSPPSNLSSSS